jgi:RNA polymerase sigma-70 factor (family 1)
MKKGIILNNTEINELQHCIAEYDDEQAYKKLFFYFFLSLKGFAFSIIKSNEEAEEIVSDVFTKIWIDRKQLTAIEHLKMYLYTCVRNASLRKLEQKSKATIVELEAIPTTISTLDDSVETILITKELRERIEFSINQLPEKCKIIFKLAKEDLLKYSEISKLLNISVKTIDSQIAIAVKKIAATLRINAKKHLPK